MKFDFTELYGHLYNITNNFNITTGPELQTENEITSLSPATCKTLTLGHWSRYDFDDFWTRQATWKLPLIQLLFLFNRQPFGLTAQCFAILHLVADPISTLASLLLTIEHCQVRANIIRRHCISERRSRSSSQRLSSQHPDRDAARRFQQHFDYEWKAFSLLLISYEEHGVQEGQAFLTEALTQLADMDVRYAQRIRKHFYHAAGSLGADRSTLFLPMLVAQAIFLGSFLIPLIRARGEIAQEHNWLNIDAHAVAVSMALSFLSPAVFLSKVLGASQTESKVSRVLNSLRDNLNVEKAKLEEEAGRDVFSVIVPPVIPLPQYWASNDVSRLSESPDQPESWPTGSRNDSTRPLVTSEDAIEALRLSELALRTDLPEHSDSMSLDERINAGGFYCFRPDLFQRISPSKSTSNCKPRLQIAVAISFITVSVLIANIISWRVPPTGFDCRNLGETGLMCWWSLSFGLDWYLKNKKHRFASMFCKDLFFATTIVTFLVLIQVGIFNRCICYNLWGRTPLMLPQLDSVATTLLHRVEHEWLRWTIAGILGEIAMCFAVCWHYRLACRVFLQRDDGLSNLHGWPQWVRAILRWREFTSSPSLASKKQGGESNPSNGIYLGPVRRSSTFEVDVP